MKKKISLGILILLVILVVYGITKLMPIIKLLRDVDLSELMPPVDEEQEMLNEAPANPKDNTGIEGSSSTKDSETINKVSGNDVNTIKNATNEQSKNTTIKAISTSNTDNTNNINSSKNCNNSTSEKSDAIVISGDKIASVEKDISFADKAKAVKLVISNLSASDIKTLKNLADGGLTPEEKAQAVQIAYSKYSQEELKLIKELYHKYLGK